MRSIDKLRNKTKKWRWDPVVPITGIYRKLRALMKLTLNVVYVIPATLLWLFNCRFPSILTSYLGHLLLEPDVLIKEMRLGLAPRRRHILLAPRGNVANLAAIAYWEKYYTVFMSSFAVLLLRPLSWHPFIRMDVSKYGIAINQTAECVRIQSMWQGRAPLLRINDNDERKGRQYLAKIGVPSGGWFVCVHCREGGYRPVAENSQSYRSNSFDACLVAIDYIVSLGGVCIRMGDPSMGQIPKKPGLIDYAHEPDRCDWLDLYLSAKCRVFLGSASGPTNMSMVFGVPIACANMAPMSSVYPFDANDIGIPKLYKEKLTGRLLPFKRILDLPMGNFRYQIEFDQEGIEVVENSPDEILDLLVERLQRVNDPGFSYTEKEELLQQRFRNLFRPGHYCYGATSRVGTSFLRKYQDLLPPD